MDTPKVKSVPAAEAIESAADDNREPSKEEILEDLRIALRDTLAGKEAIPAREGLEAIRRRIYGDADHS